MTPPGISPYKISKDLEEKAKEARQKKEQLDSILPEYRKANDILLSYGIEKFKETFKKIENLYNEKKYLDAYDEFIKIKDEMDAELKNLRKNLIDDNKKFVEKFISMGYDLSSFENDLENAPQNIEDFLAYLKNFNIKLRNEIKNLLNNKIAPLDSETKLKLLKTYGKQVESIDSLPEKDLESLIESIKKEITEHYMKKINVEMERIDKLRSIFDKMKISTTNFKNIEERVFNSIRAENYNDAIKMLRDFNDQTEISTRRIIGEILNNLNKNVEEAGFLGIDTKNFKTELKKIEEYFEKGDYLEVIDMVRALNISLEESKFNIIEHKLEEVRELILNLKNQGINVTEFSKLFDSAKNMISSKKYLDSMKTLDLLLDRLKLIGKQKEELLETINEFKNNIKNFSQLGISINRDYLEKIGKMAMEDPAKAKAEFEKYYSNISKRIEKSRTDYKEQMIQILTILKEIGTDVSTLSNIVNGNMEGYEFLIRINEFREKILDMLKEGLGIDKKFENPEYYIREIKPLIDSVIENISAFDFSSALSGLKRIKESTMDLRDIFISEKIKNAIKTINDLGSLGLDIKGISEDLNLISQEKQISAEEKLNIVSSIEKVIKDEINKFTYPREYFAESIQKNIEIKNIRVNTEILSKRLYDLKNSINRNDHANSMKIAMDIENSSKTMMVTSMIYITTNSMMAKKLSKFIPGMDKLINELKEYPLDEFEQRFKEMLFSMDQIYAMNSLTNLRNLIREIQEIIDQTNKFQDRKNLLDMKNVDMEALEPIYSGLEKIKNDFKGMVYERILDIHLIISKLPVKDPLNKLNSAMDKYLDGNYLETWKYLDEIEKYVNSILKDYEDASKILNDIEERINFFINIGMVLEKSTNIFNDLRAYISRGDFLGFRDNYRSIYLTIKDEIYTQVDNFLNQIEKLIIERKGKINTLIAEGLLTSARRTLKLDNAVEAIKQGLEALENIQEYQFLKKISDNFMKRMKLSMEKFGGQAPKEFTIGFDHVQLLLNQRKYAQAIIEMNNLLSKFEDLSEKIILIKKKIEEIKEKISVGVLFGFKTQNVVELYQKARSSFQSMEIDKSLQLLDEAIREISIGIDRILGIYMNSIDYLEKIAKLLGIDVGDKINEIRKLSRNIIEFSFRRNNKNNETITNVANALKLNLDKFEEENVPEIARALESKLKDLENALAAIGKENNPDIELIRNTWSKKLYLIVLDALPMIEYKITKFYVIHILDFSKDAFTEITDRIVFSEKIENYVIDSYKFSENSGDLEFDQYVSNMEKFKNELENAIIENFNKKIASLKEDFKNINTVEISSLNEYLLKKDYRSLEVSIIKMGIIYSWTRLVAEYISSRIESINSRIKELKNLGYDLKEEENLVKNISGKTYSEALSILSRLNDLLIKKEEILPVSFNLKINARIGKDEIPLNLTLLNKGNVMLKNVNVELSGAIQKIEINIEQLYPEKPFEKNLIAISNNGETLDIKISYAWKNIVHENKKSLLLDTKIEHGFTEKKATGEERCSLCRGKIFKDLDMVICNRCGATYHYQCAQRIKKCIVCGNTFDFSEQKELEVSVDL